MYTKGKKQGITRFVIRPEGGAKKVFLAGDFSGWECLAMVRRKDGAFARNVAISPGEFEYKFIVDGQWITDPDHGDWAVSPVGTLNSVGSAPNGPLSG